MSALQAHAGGFLASLGTRERDALLRVGTQVRCPPGRLLIEEGGHALTLAVLLEGRVTVSITTEAGTELLLAIRGPGELLGELSTLVGEPRSANAVAIDHVRLLVVQLPAFQQLLVDEPRMSTSLIRMLVERVREADQMRVELTLDAPLRVARMLVRLAEAFGVPALGGGVQIDLPLTQDELAGLTALSRGALAEALRVLREAGVIATARRRITVLDLDALRERVEAA